MHTLRPTFASHVVMSGEPLPAVQKLLKHSTITTTMIYAHMARGCLTNSVASLKYGYRDVTQASLKETAGGKEWRRGASKFMYGEHLVSWAGVVELADTGDLKSPDWQQSYGFDPRLRHLKSYDISSSKFLDNSLPRGLPSHYAKK